MRFLFRGLFVQENHLMKYCSSFLQEILGDSVSFTHSHKLQKCQHVTQAEVCFAPLQAMISYTPSNSGKTMFMTFSQLVCVLSLMTAPFECSTTIHLVSVMPSVMKGVLMFNHCHRPMNLFLETVNKKTLLFFYKLGCIGRIAICDHRLIHKELRLRPW